MRGVRTTLPFLLVALRAAAPSVLAAQAAPVADTAVAPAPASRPHAIRWYEGAIVVGGVGIAALLDESVRSSVQGSRTPGRNSFAADVRHFGQPEVYATIGGGVLVAGLVSGRPGLTRAGLRISSAIAAAGLTAEVVKYAIGRSRPLAELGNYHFSPGTVDASFPSGHTTTAFALATTLSHEIKSPVATVGLFALATATGWSRINDDKHWFSDTVVGALLGITAGQISEGKWTLFGVHAPRVFMSPRGAVLGWSGSF